MAYRDGDWKYVQSPQEGEFLFHLGDDPNETTDRKREESARFEALREAAVAKAEELRLSSQSEN